MSVFLTPHPSTPCVDALTLEVTVGLTGERARLDYILSGPVETVRWPGSAPSEHTDNLWQTTCFEAFVQTHAGYAEYNLSPSGAWAAYGFDGYRQDMRRLVTTVPEITSQPGPGVFTLSAMVRMPERASGVFGLSAVIERLEGSIQYWALAHPSDKPDFHHSDSFCLDLR